MHKIKFSEIMYKISIILPVYNVEEYLPECFESLFNQTIGFSNLQIIFVDDKSKDNSCNIIDEYSKKYDNVISIHLHENSGTPSKPRNEGMKFAFADYLLFLDPDDVLMNNACETLYSKVITSNADIIVSGYKKENWLAYWKSILNTEETLIEKPKYNISIYFNPPGLGSKLFKKELIINNSIKFPEKTAGEDLYFLTKAYITANSILSLNNYIAYEYSVRKDENNKSITQSIDIDSIYSLLEAYNLTLDMLEELKINTNLIKLLFTKNHFNFFRVQINNSNITEKEVTELFNSKTFIKFRNRYFILNDVELNSFFNEFIENPKSVEGTKLQSICRRTKKELLKSKRFINEIPYQNNYLNEFEEENQVWDIEKKLYSFIKQNAELNNMIGEYKKSE